MWKNDIGQTYYDGGGERLSTTTPVFYNESRYMILGTQYPADILVLEVATGNLVFRMNLDSHSYSRVEMSGTLHQNVYYVGISSRWSDLVELEAEDDGCPFCTFAGSFSAVDLVTREVAWTFDTIPPAQTGSTMWAGAPVRGSTPPIDLLTNTVYFATGGYYRVPDAFETCVNVTEASAREVACFRSAYPEVWGNSVIGLDLSSGTKRVARRFGQAESWIAACTYFNGNCPAGAPDPEADFTMSPSLDYHATCACDPPDAPPYNGRADQGGASNTQKVGTCPDPVTGRPVVKTVCSPSGSNNYAQTPFLYIGQTNGVAFKLSAATLDIVWAKKVGPGGFIGGFTKGGALDSYRYYLSMVNNQQDTWILNNGTTTTGGGWAALDKLTGAVLWTTSNPASYDPSGSAGNPASNGRSTTAWGVGPPLSVRGGVLVTSFDSVRVPNLGTSMVNVYEPGGASKLINVGTDNDWAWGQGGYVYELDGATGKIISSYQTGASVYDGFSVDNYCAWLGTGYLTFPLEQGTWGTFVYGWCVTGDQFYSVGL
jgi:polyvinyl alcohol dehydrogenase (cytochrome)